MKFLRFTALALVFTALTAFVQKDAWRSLYTYMDYIGARGDTLKYRLLSPQHAVKNKKYPLVILFHGAGERGYDNETQLQIGAKLYTLPANLKKYPCYVLVPQCPPNAKWVDTDWKLERHTMSKEPARYMELTMELLGDMLWRYPIDKSRVYVTGPSMGGFATWDIMMRRPEIFAAAAPVCGGGDETHAKEIKDIPVWVFHGAKDKLVKVSRSRNMVAALKKAGAHPVYTEYATVGHNAWDSAYKDSRILDWMFSKSKK